MGGAVIGSNRFYNLLMLYRKDFGGVLSPKNAWPILVYGLPTLATRMVNQQKGAMMVANFLLKQSKVARVVYPGLPNFPPGRAGAPADGGLRRQVRSRKPALFRVEKLQRQRRHGRRALRGLRRRARLHDHARRQPGPNQDPDRESVFDDARHGARGG